MMDTFIKEIEAANSIVIVGHIRPDGDCVGSCLGLYNYIIDNYGDKKVRVYLQEFSKSFSLLNGVDKVLHELDNNTYDLCIALDSGDIDRLGEFVKYYNEASKTVCVDHHISNTGYGDVCYVYADKSSTSEAICTLINMDKLTKNSAECFYLGVVHDTGVFKHSNTTRETMCIAGALLEKGARSNVIIDDTFYKKTYIQNQLLGRALLESFTMLEGRCIVAVLKKSVFDFYNATSMDCDGIVDQLRITEGVEVAMFIYESARDTYKISLRSNSVVNVSEIASEFGGGGHIRAAGFSLSGNIFDIINNIVLHIDKQLDEA